MKSAALVLALLASALAKDVAPSFPGNAVPPKVTPAPKGPQPDAAQIAGPSQSTPPILSVKFLRLLKTGTMANLTHEPVYTCLSVTTPAAQLLLITLIMVH